MTLQLNDHCKTFSNSKSPFLSDYELFTAAIFRVLKCFLVPGAAFAFNKLSEPQTEELCVIVLLPLKSVYVIS